MALFLKKSLSVPLRISLPPITHSNFQSKGTSRISGWRTEDEIKTLFDEWAIKYVRTYTGVEREERLQIWRNTLRIVEVHNNTDYPYETKGLNKFSDLTKEKFLPLGKGTDPFAVVDVDRMNTAFGRTTDNNSSKKP